jgi:hypothetical protein
MKVGPLHLILDPNDRLQCAECGCVLLNCVAFIRGRTILDFVGKAKYRVGVVFCTTCEEKTRATEKGAYLDNAE